MNILCKTASQNSHTLPHQPPVSLPPAQTPRRNATIFDRSFTPPHHHPSRHRPEEIRRIDNEPQHRSGGVLGQAPAERVCPPHLRPLQALAQTGSEAAKLPNPKYNPKSYAQMTRPGPHGRIDVKFVPTACLVGYAVGQKFYQYTDTPARQYAFIDERSRFRYPEAFEEHGAFFPASFFAMLLKSSFMPLHISKPYRFGIHQQAQRLQSRPACTP